MREGISILDIGCAQGGFSNIISNNIKNFKYTGLDISKSMIERARLKYPQHTFHQINEADFSPIGNEKYDLVLAFGILHIHEKWRETLKLTWKHCAKTLLLDMRETSQKTVEDKEKSYFCMREAKTKEEIVQFSIPYNVINTSEALEIIRTMCHGYSNIYRYGYYHPISEYAKSSVNPVMATVYCIKK